DRKSLKLPASEASGFEAFVPVLLTAFVPLLLILAPVVVALAAVMLMVGFELGAVWWVLSVGQRSCDQIDAPSRCHDRGGRQGACFHRIGFRDSGGWALSASVGRV